MNAWRFRPTILASRQHVDVGVSAGLAFAHLCQKLEDTSPVKLRDVHPGADRADHDIIGAGVGCNLGDCEAARRSAHDVPHILLTEPLFAEAPVFRDQRVVRLPLEDRILKRRLFRPADETCFHHPLQEQFDGHLLVGLAGAVDVGGRCRFAVSGFSIRTDQNQSLPRRRGLASVTFSFRSNGISDHPAEVPDR